MKFNIISFGCKVNTYESEFMKEQLLSKDSHFIIKNTQEGQENGSCRRINSH